MRSAGTSKRRNTFIDGCHKTLAVVPCAPAAPLCATAAFDAIAPTTSIAKIPLRNIASLPMSRYGDECASHELSVQSRPMWKVLVALLVLGVGAAALWVNA